VRSKTMREARRKAHEVLNSQASRPRRRAFASDLIPSEKRRLEVAPPLATEPKLLLLDEVLTGVTPIERNRVSNWSRVRETGVHRADGSSMSWRS